MKVAQSCPTLCNPMDTIRGILQAWILEWVAFPFSRGSFQPRDWTQVSRIAGGFFTSWATREVSVIYSLIACQNKFKNLSKNAARDLLCKCRYFVKNNLEIVNWHVFGQIVSGLFPFFFFNLKTTLAIINSVITTFCH